MFLSKDIIQFLKNSAIFISFWSEWTKKVVHAEFQFLLKSCTARYAKCGVKGIVKLKLLVIPWD